MNSKKSGYVRLLLALLTGALLTPTLRAQPTNQFAGQRFLFIFDTSSEMKNRIAATQWEIKDLLATGMAGRLRGGDSIGAWTFDRKLRTGQFPLQWWRPDDAARIAEGIAKFVGDQRYSGNASFAVLQPLLNQVIHDSPRLTVLIFCDGGDEIKWTPYDKGINEVFQARQAELKESHQPFVIVLRTQNGKYAGCTINFPPGMVNFPEFTAPSRPGIADPATVARAPVILTNTVTVTKSTNTFKVPVPSDSQQKLRSPRASQ